MARRFSRKAFSLPPEPRESDSDGEEAEDLETLDSLGLTMTETFIENPPLSRNGGKDFQGVVRGLLDLLRYVRGKIGGGHGPLFYEMGLRSAHATEALLAGERDRAAAHITRIGTVARKAGFRLSGPFSLKAVRALAKTPRENRLITVGFHMSQFEEVIARMDLEKAEALIEKLLHAVESLPEDRK